jgi:hypothetical protein
VVAAVVEGLLAAGLPAQNIVVWDKHAIDLRLAGSTNWPSGMAYEWLRAR